MVCVIKMGEVSVNEPSKQRNTPKGSFLLYRLLGFIGCLIGAAVCFFVAFLTLPLLALRYVFNVMQQFPLLQSNSTSSPAKFALAFR